MFVTALRLNMRKFISVAHLVVLIIEKQEEIHSFIVFQRILTEEGFG